MERDLFDLYGAHWTPAGHSMVADRAAMFSEQNIAQVDEPSASFRAAHANRAR